jgi:CHAT domain-containing protein
MATVKGEYAGSKRLEEAEKEADHLKESYRAAQVPARIGPILDCVGKATPPAQILHMAVHGRFDHTGTQDGILMEDGKYLRPRSIRGLKQTAQVDVIDVGMVFLNACQLGQAQEMLGEYAGMATAFTSLGVDAVIAPLWKVDDAVARQVAEGFYKAVLGDEGVSPGEYLRRERHATKGKEALAEGTRLAYLFFGHPRLRVGWTPGGN